MTSFAEPSKKLPGSKMVETAWTVFEERLKSQQHLDCQDFLKLMERVESLEIEDDLKQKILSCIDAMGSARVDTLLGKQNARAVRV